MSKKNYTLRARIILYSVISVGLSIMELFRSKFAYHVSWKTALLQSGRKLLVFSLIFLGIELLYLIIRRVKQKKRR